MERAQSRRLLAAGAGFGLVAALLAYVGPRAVAQSLATADLAFIALAFVAYLTFFALRGVRWMLLLRPIVPDASAATAASLSAAGWLVSTWVPLKAGDVTRAALMARRHRASLLGVGGTVGLERAVDVLGLAAAATVGLMVLEMYGEWHLPPLVARAIGLAWILPILGLVALVLIARQLGRRAQSHRILKMADRVVDATRWLAARPRQAFPIGVLTLAIVACQAAVFAFLFLAFDPDAARLPAAAGAPLFLLSFIISVTPGNVGTYEASFVAVYTLLGFDPIGLLAMAVAIHLTTITFVTALGGAGWLAFTLQTRAVERATPTPVPPAASEAAP